MRLASYFFVSLAVHGMILSLPLSSFREARERIVPVTLRLERAKDTGPKRALPAAAAPRLPANPIQMPSRKPPAVSRPVTKVADYQSDDKKEIIESQSWPVRELSTVDEVAEIKASRPRPIEKPARRTVAPVPADREQAPAAATNKVKAPGDDLGITIGEDNDPRADFTFSRASYAYNPKPDYPDEAKREGWEGTVLLRVLVGPHGAPESIEVNRSSGFEVLDRAARDSVRNWRFHPAYYGDRQVPSWVRIPIVFRLKDAQT